MRLLDWTTVLLVLGIVVGTASAAVLAWLGVALVSGPVGTMDGAVFDNPYTRMMGIFYLVAGIGCAVAAGYCTYMLWDKYREWRRWLRSKPGYSTWSIAKEAEERRKWA